MAPNLSTHTITHDGFVEVVAINKKALVVGHNNLMHARYRMTLQEQRLFLWVVSMVQPEDDDFKKYRIKVADLAELIGVDKENLYSRMTELTRRLMSRVAELFEIETNVLRQRQLVSATDYYLGQGILEIQVHPDLRPYVLKLKKNFTAIELEMAIRLSSFYAIRLYEIAKAFAFKGPQFAMDLGTLRAELGIGPDEYAEFWNFKTRVLDSACAEISATTDIGLAWKGERSGRKITRVAFKIADKTPTAVASALLSGEASIVARLVRIGMPESEVAHLMTHFASDKARVTAHLDMVEDQQRTGKVRQPLAWFRAAVKKDYRNSRPKLAARASGNEERRRIAASREPGEANSEPRQLGGFDHILRRLDQNQQGLAGSVA